MFVTLGMTDDSYTIKDSVKMSNRDYINYFLSLNPKESTESKIKNQFELNILLIVSVLRISLKIL